ncbi:cadherin-like beta sandwich domain-containing protein [Erysipelothrix inopinata]|uniref:Cadherin-like beta sandwich domain-containing protein n=1 Tax=Erysipelothrix inopinata TaxID=225084 RepID=A0A7G9RYF4_9FIRM|nr:cadherin-like beta sandwich domain-containing protein [Erysipelothrix inopinata]QNN60629.1 cadherin-like beta sandwich domain-containing protein [Erysipelothrix inopinata]
MKKTMRNQTTLIRGIVVLLMILSMLVLQLVIPLSATTPKLIIEPEQKDVTRGERVHLQVKLSEVQAFKNGVEGYSGTFQYDPSVLTFIEAKNKISGWAFSTAPTSGEIKFVGYDDNPPNIAQKEDIVAFEIEVEILESAPSGATKIAIKNAAVADTQFNELDASTKESVLNIVDKSNPEESSNNQLKELIIKDGDTKLELNPKFNENTLDYKLEVGENTNTIDISALPVDEHSKVISGTGSHELKPGENIIKIVVEAEDGTQKTYTVVVTKKDKDKEENPGGEKPDPKPEEKPDPKPEEKPTPGDKEEKPKPDTDKPTSETGKDSNGNTTIINNNSVNNYISTIEGISLQPNLSHDVNEYHANVGKNTDRLNLKVTPEDQNASVNITGHESLTFGANQITITVTSPSGEKRDITINVNRSETESSAYLSSISVGGYALNPGFKEDVFFYNMIVEHDVNHLAVTAAPKDANTNINIAANNTLREGINYIKIHASNADGIMNTYVIEVIRESESTGFKLDHSVLWAGVGTIWILILAVVFIMTRKKPKTIVYEKSQHDEKI